MIAFASTMTRTGCGITIIHHDPAMAAWGLVCEQCGLAPAEWQVTASIERLNPFVSEVCAACADRLRASL